MNDKDWLDKVHTAFVEYEKLCGSQLHAYNFVNWLYKQYGIVPPNRKE